MSHKQNDLQAEQQREGIEEMRAQRNYKDFEDFLQDKFIESNPTVLDDDIPDAFDDWLTELDVDDLIAYGDQYYKTGRK